MPPPPWARTQQACSQALLRAGQMPEPSGVAEMEPDGKGEGRRGRSLEPTVAALPPRVLKSSYHAKALGRSRTGLRARLWKAFL